MLCRGWACQACFCGRGGGRADGQKRSVSFTLQSSLKLLDACGCMGHISPWIKQMKVSLWEPIRCFMSQWSFSKSAYKLKFWVNLFKYVALPIVATLENELGSGMSFLKRKNRSQACPACVESAREGVDAGKRNLLLEFLYDLDGSVLCTKWVGELAILLFLPNIPYLQRFVFPPAVKASLASFPLEICQQVLAVRVIGKARATKRTIFVLLKWWGMLVVLESPRSHCLLSMSFLKVCLWVPVLLYEDDLSKKWSVDVLSAVATPQDGLGSSLSVLQKLTNQKLCSVYGECPQACPACVESAREGVDTGKNKVFLEFLFDLDGSVLCTKWVGELAILLFLPNIPYLQRFVFPPAVKASLASFPYHLRYANKSLLFGSLAKHVPQKEQFLFCSNGEVCLWC